MWSFFPLFPGVYPRACGGAPKQFLTICLRKGLSPRLRGSRGGLSAGSHRRGSIPAPAGEPGSAPFFAAAVGVYPRACGGACCKIIARILY